MSQKCVNNPDNLCYICLKEMFACSNYKEEYFMYFGCKVGEQDKKWTPHVCCTTCSSKLNVWVNGKGRCLSFMMPMGWRKPSNHCTDCYFCIVPSIQNGMSMKKKSTLVYHSNISSSIRPVPHGDGLPVLNIRTILLCTLTTKTVFVQTAKNSSHQLQEMQTTCQAQTPPIIRSQKTSSMTSSGISNFQKIRQNFWHQGYNSILT